MLERTSIDSTEEPFPMPPVLYDGRELAAAIGATYKDVMSWSRRGIIPRIKVGRHVVFNLSEVVAALRARKGAEKSGTASTFG
jgi:hypothetical protein